MLPDDAAAAGVAGEREKLGEKFLREDAGVAALAVVGGADDAVGLPRPALGHRADGVRPQQRLIGHHIQNRVAVQHYLRPKKNRPAHAELRRPVFDRVEAVRLCQRQRPIVLAHDRHAGEAFCWDGQQRKLQKRRSAICGEELVFSKTVGVSGRHDEAAEFGCACHGKDLRDFLQISIVVFEQLCKEAPRISAISKKALYRK